MAGQVVETAQVVDGIDRSVLGVGSEGRTILIGGQGRRQGLIGV